MASLIHRPQWDDPFARVDASALADEDNSDAPINAAPVHLASALQTPPLSRADGSILSAQTNSAPTITGPAVPGLTVSSVALASSDSSGVQGNGGSQNPAFSPDGTKLAFMSVASNLVPGDTNSTGTDIFIKDLTTGAIVRVNTDSSGMQTNGVDSFAPRFSPDGTKVVFVSVASNLVAGDTNGWGDIFIKDPATGAIQRVSTDSTGQQADGNSGAPSFSPDGTKMAFESSATNLIVGDTNGQYDIFLKDLTTGAVTRVSTDSSGSQSNGLSVIPAFSPDGTKVLFVSEATNLVAGDTNGWADVFIKDLTTGTTTRVSTDASGAQADGGVSNYGVFSPDGTKVLFQSYATNLVAGDTNGTTDIFLKDLTTGAITRVSTDAFGAEGNGFSESAVFSSDGTRVVFASGASNLVAGDTNDREDIFVKDLTTGAVSRVSTNASGTQANQESFNPVISSDGTKIAYWSYATNLAPGDATAAPDVFVATLDLHGPSLAEDTSLVLSTANGNAITVSDSDGGSGSETVTLSALHGTLTLAQTTNLTGVAGNGTASVSFSGTLVDLNAALDGLIYAPVHNYNGADTIQVHLNDNGNSGGSPLSATYALPLSITPVDDPAVAQNDAFTTDQVTAIGIGLSLFANNGSGPDDPDGGPPLTITGVSGGGVVGEQFALASGALLTVYADGTFAYDPNHAFDSLNLASPGSGAANTSTTDSFTYMLDGGTSATVTITVNGVDSPETIYDGTPGNDTLTGGPGGHIFDLSGGGNDTVTGGSGNDGFKFGAAFNASDHVDGGLGGIDELGLEGDYSDGLTLSGANVQNVEVVVLLPGFDYTITTTDDLVRPGENFSVWSLSMLAPNHVIFDASADTDSNFHFFLGHGNDIATGGGGNDLFFGEGGQDTLKGNGGVDTFAYIAPSDSTGAAYDRILDFTAGTDKFDLPVTVTGVDTAVAAGALSAASFDANLAAAIGAGQMAAGHAVLFTPDTGDLSGHTFLIVDANNTAGYQASADYVFDLTGGTGLAGLATTDFI